MNKLSLIIPVLNEGAHIGAILEEVMEASKNRVSKTDLEWFEVLVVNDGSTDQTSSELEKFKNHSNFRVVTHSQNRGYGAALKTGFGEASGNYLSFMDGDGTISAHSIFDLYESLRAENADMVVGKRFGGNDSQMPLIRKMGNLFFAKLLSFLSNQVVTDTASGVRVFKKEILVNLYPLPDGLHFTPAMSSKAVHEKIKIFESPIEYSERSGKSKLNVLKDGFRFLNIIMDTVLMYNPFKVFSLLGFVLIAVAGVLLIEPIHDLIFHEHVTFSDYIYRSIGALYFFVGGVQIILFGILARFLVSTFFKRHESGKLIHQLNDYLNIYETLGWWGLITLLLGLAINALYFARYFFFGNLNMHWSFLLIGAGLIIVGLQMIITGVIMKIVKNINKSIKS